MGCPRGRVEWTEADTWPRDEDEGIARFHNFISRVRYAQSGSVEAGDAGTTGCMCERQHTSIGRCKPWADGMGRGAALLACCGARPWLGLGLRLEVLAAARSSPTSRPRDKAPHANKTIFPRAARLLTSNSPPEGEQSLRWLGLAAMSEYHQYDGPPRPRPKSTSFLCCIVE